MEEAVVVTRGRASCCGCCFCCLGEEVMTSCSGSMGGDGEDLAECGDEEGDGVVGED